MNLLLIGPPGSGKGTQGEQLSLLLGLEHIAAGDLLRAEVAAGTDIGREVARQMKAGELVPDQVVMDLVIPKVFAAAAGHGYLLDGFPRSVAQAQTARKLAEEVGATPDAVIYLDVPHSELIRRILARAELEGRADDNPETVETRLQVFDESTHPLVEYYRNRQLLHVIDASQDTASVTAAIVAALTAAGVYQPHPAQLTVHEPDGVAGTR